MTGVEIMYFELNIFHCIKTYTKVLETSSNNLHVILIKNENTRNITQYVEHAQS